MGTISYSVRPEYNANYLGGLIRVGTTRELNVKAALTAGGGTIAADDTDQELIVALDGYAPLYRTGTSPTVPTPVARLESPRVSALPDATGVVTRAADGTYGVSPGGGGAGVDQTARDGVAANAAAIAARIPAALVDAKGDVLVGSADDTVTRKAVGADGTVLTADTASAGGVKWAVLGTTPTATKTANYTAAANEAVPVDATAAATTVTLPTAPAVGSVVIVKKVDPTRNVVTIAAGGSDTIDGLTSVVLRDRNTARTLRMGPGSVWVVSEGLTPVAGIGNARADRLSGVYIPDDTALLNLRKAMARMRAGGAAARLLGRGDSTLYGVLSGTNPLNLVRRDYVWLYRARQMLAASQAVGKVEESIMQMATVDDSRFTYGSGWSGSTPAWTAGATGTMTFAEVAGGHDAFDLMVFRQGSAPSISVSVDGGSAQVLDLTTVPNNTAGQFRVTATGTAAHTLVITPSATGTGAIYLLEPVLTTAPGLKIGGFGISGQRFSALNPAVTTVGNPMFPLLASKPDGMLLRMGINDVKDVATAAAMPAGAATYKTGIKAWNAAFRANNCDPIHVLFPSYNTNGNAGVQGAYESAQFHQAVYEAADEDNVMVIDLQRRFGYGAAATTGTALYDGTHDTLVGNWDVAAMLHDVLARGL